MSEIKETEIETRVRQIVSEIAPDPPKVLESTSRLAQDLMFDSVTLLELAVALETEFDLAAITAVDTESLLTVGDLAKFIAQRVAVSR